MLTHPECSADGIGIIRITARRRGIRVLPPGPRASVAGRLSLADPEWELS
jgi:hypothetical protein